MTISKAPTDQYCRLWKIQLQGHRCSRTDVHERGIQYNERWIHFTIRRVWFRHEHDRQRTSQFCTDTRYVVVHSFIELLVANISCWCGTLIGLIVICWWKSGMVVGSFIWGCIADTSGRRLALLTCLFLQALFECAASIVSDYWSFLALKFGNGLA